MIRPYAQLCLDSVPTYLGSNTKGVNDPLARQLPLAIKGLTLALRLVAVAAFRSGGPILSVCRTLNFSGAASISPFHRAMRRGALAHQSTLRFISSGEGCVVLEFQRVGSAAR